MRNLFIILALGLFIMSCEQLENTDWCAITDTNRAIDAYCAQQQREAAIEAFQNRSFDGVGTYTTGDGDPNN